MPRKPTGRPVGRPPGGGKLGDHIRLTVRIPQALYDRLETYADGRTFTRGAPQLAICVREALEMYLEQPRRVTFPTRDKTRQTLIEPVPVGDEIRQTRKVVLPTRDKTRQTLIEPVPVGDEIRQTRKVVLPTRDKTRQTLIEPVPAFDSTKYALGKLCPRGHEHGTTGKSLLQKSSKKCLLCHREQGRERREVKRQTSP